jgi:hypothetical protein
MDMILFDIVTIATEVLHILQSSSLAYFMRLLLIPLNSRAIGSEIFLTILEHRDERQRHYTVI